MSHLEDALLLQMKAIGLQPEQQYRPWQERRFKYDFAFPALRLLIDVQGGTWIKKKTGHSSGSGMRDDAIKHGLAALSGYRVLLFTSDMISNGVALDFIEVATGAGTLDKAAAPLRDRVMRAGLKQ